MNVLIVDDHHLFRSGLKVLLTSLAPNLHFSECETCEQALTLEGKAEIDLLLLDFHLPQIKGYEALDLLRQVYHCSIVLLSSEESPDIIRLAISKGASGFIPKSSSPEILIAALKLVLAKGIYLPPNILDGIEIADEREMLQADALEKLKQSMLTELSERQLSVLIKATQGKPNKVIAKELNIAEGTVKAHLSACYRVLNVQSRTEAVYKSALFQLSSTDAASGVEE